MVLTAGNDSVSPKPKTRRSIREVLAILRAGR
jgi:hypothetical protein